MEKRNYNGSDGTRKKPDVVKKDWAFRKASIPGVKTVDEETRSIGFVVATSDAVEVWDSSRYEVVKEHLLMTGVELPRSGQVPLLDDHSTYSSAAVLGSVRDLEVQGDELLGRGFFSTAPESESPWIKTKEGHLTDVSAGYRRIDSQWVPEGETYTFQGNSFVGPCVVTKRWRLKEVSILPIGADERAKARGEAKPQKSNHLEANKMHDELKKLLIARGMSADATEAEAWAFFFKINNVQRSAPDGNQDPAAATTDDPPAIDENAIRVEAANRERERISEISAMGERFNQTEIARRCVSENISVDNARKLVMDAVAAQQTAGADIPAAGQSAVIVADERDKFRAACQDALFIRAAGSKPELRPLVPKEPAPGANDLAGLTLVELARQSLMVANVKIPSNRTEVVKRAMVTGDFPNILANVANISLFTGWDAAEETWSRWVDTIDLPDFKTHYLPRISEFSDLDEIPEHGHYRYGKRSDAAEAFALTTWGKLFAITRQTIINDELGALTMDLANWGETAARKVGDVVYAVLTANAAMGDGTALFASGHSNLVAGGSGAAPGSATLKAALLAMGTQKNLLTKQTLGIVPQFLIAPKALEGGTEEFLLSKNYTDSGTIGTPDAAYSTTRANIYQGRFERIYEHRLDTDDAAKWYMAAAKGKTVVAAFLEGQGQKPYMEEKTGWTVDGVEYKLRIDVCAKARDWVGLYCNDGN